MAAALSLKKPSTYQISTSHECCASCSLISCHTMTHNARQAKTRMSHFSHHIALQGSAVGHYVNFPILVYCDRWSSTSSSTALILPSPPRQPWLYFPLFLHMSPGCCVRPARTLDDVQLRSIGSELNPYVLVYTPNLPTLSYICGEQSTGCGVQTQ